uniref:Mhc class I A n=1 Tax=Nothobranchius kadleci TaxID=1051664 RepID=A0A1A8DWM8_NOTKA
MVLSQGFNIKCKHKNTVKMFLAFGVFLLLTHHLEAVTHSLQYFYTTSSGVNNFPEFVDVGLVDGQQIIHYDSNVKRTVPKQDWMEKNLGADYWERSTQIFVGSEQTFKVNVQIAKQRFNQTGGVHIFQYMYGCEWDDETGEVKGYYQFGYDGEDFLVLDLKSESWIAPTPQAVITKNKWDHDKGQMAHRKNYLNQICPEWLKKHVKNGRSSLMRTVLPSVSLLRKSPSSPVSCHATGFHPDRAEMFWRKDGEEIHEGVDKGEILPNNDGTFQMSVDLSPVPAEDLEKYECVFQLSGVKDDLVTRLEEPKIRTNEGNYTTYIIIIAAALVVLIAVIAVICFIIYKRKSAKRPPSPVEKTEVEEEKMLPTVLAT